MTQYPQQPSPYMPPTPSPSPANYPGYYSPYNQTDPYRQLLAPAKRSSILMFILGGLTMACGVLTGMTYHLLLSDPYTPKPPEWSQLMVQLQQASIDPSSLFIGMGACICLPGLLFIINAVFIRRGGLGAIIPAIILDSGLLLLLSAWVVVGLAHAASPGAALPLLVMIAAWSLAILLLVWLIQAIKSSAQIRAMQAQYQFQYQQYLMQQQMYSQTGYPPQQGGYYAPPPGNYPPPPAPPPPQT